MYRMYTQQCAIRTPAQYLDSLREHHDSLEHIKAQVSSVIATPSPPTGPSGAASAPPASTAAASGANLSPEERKRKQLIAGAAVSKKFMVSV